MGNIRKYIKEIIKAQMEVVPNSLNVFACLLS